MRIVVIHGPNLNLLGEREPGVYGSTTLAKIDAELVKIANELSVEVKSIQSNHEGILIDAIHALRGCCDGIIINAGGLTHTSVALRDALVAVAIPFIEVHVSNIFARESFRAHSYLSDVAKGIACGFGPLSYELGLRGIIAILRR
ncbi:MAG: type II 3-dehydroquinate dehydratase [Deltaproteobacteria bacterium]|nr:type II 3-dehydroquinate dehydratase [Deltaproteobacteria bacterium]